ncbi:MAG: VOC family protein [Planctomycetota bacterium]|nr:VOC family protein [Planctomycetota bacterium]
MSEQNTTGRFVWHDLMSTDPTTSKAFYAGLFGWRVETLAMPLGPYDMLHVGERPIGGIVPLGPDDAPGVPSHWISYVEVEDADACASRSTAAGGKTCVPIMDLPGMGRFGVLTDPDGAVISPWQHHPDAERKPLPEGLVPGVFCWDELHATDTEKAMAYYGATFGWTFETIDMGELGTYNMSKSADGTYIGGIMQTPSGHHAWLSYVAVEDVDATNAKAVELGGKSIVAPGTIPGRGRFSVLLDPTGCVFALFAGLPSDG